MGQWMVDDGRAGDFEIELFRGNRCVLHWRDNIIIRSITH